ncbi:MAG: N-6 DNA methylase, partial [Nanoarchaeota archaeon]|nr:N-6 DNA methylase [Nanoarchaeota archaeon]
MRAYFTKPNETIIDPACGSGGFLMSALKYLQKNNSN